MSRASRTFAVLGDPVRHSLSPLMHAAAFGALGVDASYAAIRCGARELPMLMRRLAMAGGGGNVTVPHKRAAEAALDRASDCATAVGACNTFWGDGGRLAGDNTDVDGILAGVDELDVPEGPWLIAGTGGSARAGIVAAARRAAPVHVCSRDAGRAEALGRWAASVGVSTADRESCVLCINATPLGLHADDPLPILFDRAPAAVAALDLVYAPGATQWVRRARARGIRAADGRGVLVGQGGAAIERWWPGRRAPLTAMRKAVNAALE